MAQAFDELARLAPAVQLTPGNLPTVDFARHVATSGVITRRHHGFSFVDRKTDVWRADGACVVSSESVHPPEDTERADGWRAWYERAAGPVLEVMYPGYALGTGHEVERAMAARWPLVVDVSHVFIQRTQGAMSDATWKRLADYDRITEVHVSANGGRHDTHRPLTEDTFGLDWARERLGNGEAVVLECYMHRLTEAQRRAQVEMIGGGP